jgi:hypothetical protein
MLKNALALWPMFDLISFHFDRSNRPLQWNIENARQDQDLFIY